MTTRTKNPRLKPKPELDLELKPKLEQEQYPGLKLKLKLEQEQYPELKPKLEPEQHLELKPKLEPEQYPDLKPKLDPNLARVQFPFHPICRQNIPLNQSQLSSEKKAFVAKVTDKLADGYAIETVIDGKLLRGIVFPNRPGFNIDIPNSSRKRTAGEAGGLMSNGDYSSKSKTSRGDLMDNVHGKAPVSHEHTEAAAGSISNHQAYSAASHLHKVTGNPEQSEVPLNLGKNQTNNAPNSTSEVAGDNRTHKPADAPNFNSAVTKESLSAVANSAAASSLNQGDRKLTSEGQNDATSI